MTMMKLGFKQKERYGYGEDGIYYPKILFETEESEKIQLGRWGREWIDFYRY